MLRLLALSCSFLAHGFTLPAGAEDDHGLSLLQRRSTVHKSRPQRPTALFIAGLEGSGHHLWAKLVNHLYKAQGDGTLPFQLKQTWFPPTVVDRVTGLERDVTWLCDRTWKEEDMDLGVELFENITHHVGHYGNEDYDEETMWITPLGCLSYPCGHGRDFTPRADWLAEAASLAGVDLHVGFLYRPFEELLLSNCVHRKMAETCDQGAATLIANAQALLGQLRAMDAMPNGEKPLVQCLRYGDLETFPQGLSNLFNHKMSFETISRDIWKPKAYDKGQENHYAEDPRDLVPNWDQLVGSLQHLDAEFQAACERADSSL